MKRRVLPLLFAVLVLTAAQSFPSDDPYVRLTRISYLEGNVSYQSLYDSNWASASVNMPLEPGDRIYTGPGGRTEIEFDDGSIIRLAEHTDVEITALRTDLIQLRILLGFAYLNARGDADFEINTPAAALNISRNGLYRFHVRENGDVDAIVRKGSLEATNDYFLQRVGQGERLYLHFADQGRPLMSRHESRDVWDEWNDRRDADRIALASRRHLPQNVHIGVAELDRHGRWVSVSDHGWVWVPHSVGSTWSPYSTGRWLYRPFYGWTWVSYEPWGWLPYHYGRWYRNVRYGWVWIPGPAFSFNFWSPGLVVFYSGPGWVSWGPLGPGDYYALSRYHFNRGIYTYQLSMLRVLHTRPPDKPFNKNIREAFRTVRIEHFLSGSFNERSAGTRWGNIDKPWEKGSLVRDRLDIRPTSASYRAAPDRPSVRPERTTVRNVVVRSDPGSNVGNRNQYTRITNPAVVEVVSGASGGANERNGVRTDIGRPDNRDSDANRRERSDPATRELTAPRSSSREPSNVNAGVRIDRNEPGARESGVREIRLSPAGPDNAGTQSPSRTSAASQVRTESGSAREAAQRSGDENRTSFPRNAGAASSGAVETNRTAVPRNSATTPPAVLSTRSGSTSAGPFEQTRSAVPQNRTSNATATGSTRSTGISAGTTNQSRSAIPQNRVTVSPATGIARSAASPSRSSEPARTVGNSTAGSRAGSSSARPTGGNSGTAQSQGNRDRSR